VFLHTDARSCLDGRETMRIDTFHICDKCGDVIETCEGRNVVRVSVNQDNHVRGTNYCPDVKGVEKKSRAVGEFCDNCIISVFKGIRL